MTKTYAIEGMKCQGCVDTVTEKLSNVLGVTGVTVDLAKNQAEIEGLTSKFLLNRALKGTKFSVGQELK
ncbi:heavy-metal-associated domain-containing protein [Streptococcus caprae]|uniref:Heavy-metal-associated domain-containing protein n=1 Tax=Streptococcus caprae TaxID=1640501 RepID=A0ABV8CW58_9STRE